jgi:hypothetical protein
MHTQLGRSTYRQPPRAPMCAVERLLQRGNAMRLPNNWKLIIAIAAFIQQVFDIINNVRQWWP